MGTARHLEFGTGVAAPLEHVDLGEEGRQIDDDTVGDHGNDVVVQDPRRNQLEGVLLAVDDHRVARVVSPLVADDERVLLREEIDDFGFALIAPLGSDDDGDGHDAPRDCWMVTPLIGTTERDEMLQPHRRANRFPRPGP